MIAGTMGLLSPDDEALVRDHLLACDACRDAAGSARPESGWDPEGAGHIPDALLARWPQASASLRGLERFLVRRHLETCPECRQGLEILGFEPVLAEVEGMEYRGSLPTGEPTVEAGADDIASIRRSNIIPMSTAPGWRRDWARWALGGWAVAATAAASVLVMRVPQPALVSVPVGPGQTIVQSEAPRSGAGQTPEGTGGRQDQPAGGLGGTTGGPRAGVSGAASLQLVSVAPLEPQTRGGLGERDSIPLLLVIPGTSTIVFQSPASLPDLPRGTPVKVELISPVDEVVAAITCRLQDLTTHEAIVLAPGNAMTSGEYRLRYRFVAPSAPDSTEAEILVSRPFRIAIRPR